ncbi:MAG: ABC transporter permease [Cyanobacteria bacterium P01_H01_bin.15]
MLRYSLNRLLSALPTLLAISFIIFAILTLAPGDPLGEFATNPAITPEVRANIRRALGLDQPWPIRYIKWLGSFLHGDLGYSFTSRAPVFDLIRQRLPTTLWVVGSAYVMSVLIGIPVALISAFKPNGWLDRGLTTLALLGFSLPTFFTGLLLIVIFSVELDWLPFIYDSTIKITNWSSFVAQIRQATLPVMALVLYQTAILVRFLRNSLLSEMSQSYVLTAQAKGLGELQTLLIHSFRNALIPVATLIALDIPAIFTGALVTEQVFRVPGIGALLIDSIQRSDTPVVMAITFIYAILIVIFNLVADLTYGWLDPRVKF